MSLEPEEKELVTEEQSALSSTLEKLRARKAELAHRTHDEEIRARALTEGIVKSRRDEDKQLLASDESVSHSLVGLWRKEFGAIDRLLDRPYFGRVVLEEEFDGRLQRIEYKIGQASNTDCRIIDWRRAPIAKLYYEYREGDEYFEVILNKERSGKVLLRNKVEIEKGNLKRLWCRLGAFSKLDEEWRRDGAASTGSRRSYGELPDILSLITADQFRTITSDAENAIFIEGVAGSGKTTVALHRLSWLLHEDNLGLKPAECLILVISTSLKNYIETTLPQLELGGVRVTTFAAWSEAVLRRYLTDVGRPGNSLARPPEESPPGVVRLKRSMAFLRRLDEYVSQQRARLVAQLQNCIDWESLSAEGGQQFASFCGSPKAPMLPFLETLLGQLKRAGEQHAASVAFVSSALKRLQLYQKDLLLILQDADALLRIDETMLLDRELIRQAQSLALKNVEQGTISAEDDPLLVRLIQLKQGGLRNVPGVPEIYRHVVVDEAQEFSAVQLAVVISMLENSDRLTVVGDTMQQTTREGSFPTWEKLRSFWSAGKDLGNLVRLSVSYRSTLPIMRLADYVSGEHRTKTGRKGARPQWYKCRNEDAGVRDAIAWLETAVLRNAGAPIAVICRSPHEARFAESLLRNTFGLAVRLGTRDSFSFEEGVIVTDVEQIKGLEFPEVLIWNPSVRCYPKDPRSRNLLYIAITRAERRLCIVTWDRPSEFLPGVHSNLVDGFDRTAEEEQEEAAG